MDKWDRSHHSLAFHCNIQYFFVLFIVFSTCSSKTVIVVDDRIDTPPGWTEFSLSELTDQSATSYLRLFGTAQYDHREFVNDSEEYFLSLNAAEESTYGQAYVEKKLRVKYGFETSFKFRVRHNHEVQTSCTTEWCTDRTTPDGEELIPKGRGDGFVFFVTNVPEDEEFPPATGTGSTLGYDGLNNTFVIEFDFYENRDLLDPDGAHVSVHFGGSEAVHASHETGLTSEPAPAYGQLYQYEPLQTRNQTDKLYEWADPNSLVNFIYPNVTPAYNHAPISSVLDTRIHDVKIDFTYPQTWKIYVDDMDEPVLEVEANLTKMILDEDYNCRVYNGCYAFPFSYREQRQEGPDTVTYEHRDPVCMIYDDISLRETTVWKSYHTSNRFGGRFNTLDYYDSKYVGLRNEWSCYRCIAYEGCTSRVGLMATTGQQPEKFEFFDWSFFSRDPPPYDTHGDIFWEMADIENYAFEEVYSDSSV